MNPETVDPSEIEDSLSATPFFCAQMSRASGEDPIGSAPSIATYIAIECPQPWAANAIESKAVPENLRAFIQSCTAAEHSIKFLLIQAAKPNPTGETQVLIFHQQTAPSSGYTRSAFQLAQITDVAPFLDRYLAMPESRPLQPIEPMQDFLICTHGSHDTCCARYGKPFFHQALGIVAELGLNDVHVWQVSHIGGHRFAPTAIAFPDGRYYGGLDGECFRAIVQRRGDIQALQPVYRGWGILPRMAQVLERELMAQYGWEWFNYRVGCRILQETTHAITVELQCEKMGVEALQYIAQIVEDESKAVYLRGSCSSDRLSRFPKYRVAQLDLRSIKIAPQNATQPSSKTRSPAFKTTAASHVGSPLPK
jgi:hypothetical protein